MAKIRAFEFITPDKWHFTHRAKVQLAVQKAKEFAAKNFQFENLEHQIDEYLRQWALRELIETYGYPETHIAVDELLKTADSSKIVGIAIKNEKKEIVALVLTGYFGETDFDFENACHKLQSDLDSVGSAFFGMVTDGRRIACLVKSDGESITDYQTVADFPAFEEFQGFTHTGQFPALKAVTQRFQKLPAPKAFSQNIEPSVMAKAVKKSNASSPNYFKPAAAKANLPAAAPKPRKSMASMAGFVACLAILGLGGAWYAGAFDKRPINAASQPATTTAKTDVDNVKVKVETNNAKPAATIQNVPVKGPTTYEEFPTQTASRPEKRGKSGRGVNSDGTIKLSDRDIAIMQTRPAANPNAKQTQSKVYTQPQTTAQSATMQKKRQVIQNPY